MPHSPIPETLAACAAAVRSGERSALELMSAALAGIHNTMDLGAFLSLTESAALEAAEAVDARIAITSPAERVDLPPLLGIPIAHKDLIDVAGSATTHGSAAVPHPIAENDAPGVGVLRAAGTIPMGKTQVPEFGLTGYSENRVAPPARNPHDRSRTAGGSSGGSAAAVAAGIFPALPGSDGGGSIRIPSLACGLVGLKPGLGTLATDLAQGAVDAFGAPTLTVSGPIARNVRDAAFLGDVMRGVDPASAPGTADGSWTSAVDRAEELRGLRIGFSTASPFESMTAIDLSPAARLAFDTAIADLVEAGHQVEPAAISYDEAYPEIFTSVWTAALSLLEFSSEAEERLMPLTREFRHRARRRTVDEHRAQAARIREIAADLRAQWGRYDAVLTPGLAFDAPKIGAFTSRSPDDDYRLQCEWAPYTSMVNVSGLPAIAVPVLPPSMERRLPFGVQLIGRAGAEAQLLQLAAQLTAVR